MYFLALRNVRCFSVLHTDVLVFVARVILTVCVIICYQVYKVFFADSRSLDGISRYRSNEMPIPDSCLRFMVSGVKTICSRFTAE